MASAGIGGVGPGYTKPCSCLVITGYDITGPESAASPIGPINLLYEVNRESVVREIRMLRLTWRELETDPQGTAPVLDPTRERLWGRFPRSTRLCNFDHSVLQNGTTGVG